jgi:uncharacterized membrane protein
VSRLLPTGAELGEQALQGAVSVLVHVVDVAGAIVIFIGAVVGFVRFGWSAVVKRGAESFTPVRLDLGRFLALGLEFQLASDLLRTAVSPSFDKIGKLAAVAAIRTVLNFFLGHEIRVESSELERRHERR